MRAWVLGWPLAGIRELSFWTVPNGLPRVISDSLLLTHYFSHVICPSILFRSISTSVATMEVLAQDRAVLSGILHHLLELPLSALHTCNSIQMLLAHCTAFTYYCKGCLITFLTLKFNCWFFFFKMLLNSPCPIPLLISFSHMTPNISATIPCTFQLEISHNSLLQTAHCMLIVHILQISCLLAKFIFLPILPYLCCIPSGVLFIFCVNSFKSSI